MRFFSLCLFAVRLSFVSIGFGFNGIFFCLLFSFFLKFLFELLGFTVRHLDVIY